MLLLILLRDYVTAQNFKPTFPLPDLIPKVCGAVPALFVDRIARRTMVAAVEGQEPGGGAIELGGHHGRHVADREMDQGPVREAEEGLRGGLSFGPGSAVEAVLIYGVLHGLGEIAFQFDGGYRH